MRSVLITITMLTVTAALVAACGGSGDSANAPTSAATSVTTAAAPSAAAATSAPPVLTTDDERSRAAAAEIFHGMIDPACTIDPPLKANNCITARSNAETLAGGIAEFSVYEPPSDVSFGEAFLGVLGRTADGAWEYWFGTQSPYALLLALPGDMRVCADGDGLNLRSEPAKDAPQVALLADGTIVRGDRFVLPEREANVDRRLPRGHGWYHITAPEDGWAYSKYLSNAASGDCSVRDTVEGGG